jgi:hypothetical protein
MLRFRDVIRPTGTVDAVDKGPPGPVVVVFDPWKEWGTIQEYDESVDAWRILF